MDFTAYAQDVIADPGRPGPVADLLRGFLRCCAGLYEGGLKLYLGAECVGLRRRTHLPTPIVSIGNLTVGGTGKTPMTQWLCRQLTARGLRVAVLSRGHGGTGTAVRVVSDTEGLVQAAAAESGDEPALLAQTLPGVPVLVGKDRRLSGREAMRRFALNVLLLDDGFQYWQLARDLDIVLLDSRRPFDNGFPLPRGLLREPMRHLQRAGMIVVTRAGRLSETDRNALEEQIHGLAPNAPVFWADHRAAGLVPAANLSAEMTPLTWLNNRSIVALSGIAQPASLCETLQASGARLTDHLVYDDHAVFGPEDVRRAEGRVRETSADALVMTEKDAVKWPMATNDIPTYALRIQMYMENEKHFLELLTARVFRRTNA